ncbi:MAG: methyltransferase family protein [Candidatus Hermodarchaeota archaeon]
MKYYIEKLIGVPFLILFIDLGFFLFAREAFTKLQTLVPILLMNAFISIDIVIRPVSAKEDKFNRSVLIISFLSMPIVFIMPYFEYRMIMNQILSPLITALISISGSVLLILGGILLLLGRIQLGEYGGPKIIVEDKHKLITTGLYQFIRHPMYLGFLLLFFGYSLAFGSFVMTIAIIFIFFLIFKNRMDIEERLLISEFGEEYLRYMGRTKRLFPFLY